MTISLTDLLAAAQRVETVTVLGKEVECRALELVDIAKVFWRFPAVQDVITGGGENVDVMALIERAPAAIGMIIAAGTGHAGDAEQEAAASQLPAAVQFDLLEPIVRLTSPRGVIPFVDRVVAMINGATGPATAPGGKALDTNSPSP